MDMFLDAIPGVGTVYRSTCAVAAHISGDHDEALRQWTQTLLGMP